MRGERPESRLARAHDRRGRKDSSARRTCGLRIRLRRWSPSSLHKQRSEDGSREYLLQSPDVAVCRIHSLLYRDSLGGERLHDPQSEFIPHLVGTCSWLPYQASACSVSDLL